jgi:hypothetical protein
MVQIIKLMLRFLKAKKVAVASVSTKPQMKGVKRYQKIVLGDGNIVFDPDRMVIKCELMANNATDRMQRVNQAVMIKQARLRIPDSELLETLGFGNPKATIEEWFDEQIDETALNYYNERVRLGLEQQVQQAQQEQMMKQQQAMQATKEQEMQRINSLAAQANQNADVGIGPEGNPAFDSQGGQGVNAAAGGQPSMMGAPGETVNQTE